MIYNVKNTSVRFFWKNDSIVRGEAVGLRGFLHFELLRLFGPVPSGADLEKPAIAYVEEMAKDPMQLRSISYKEVLEKIIRDLDEAEDYLKCDPLVEGSNYDFNNPGKVDVSFTPDDDWHYYRQRRFNYYAVKAAKARYYLWIDNKEQAAKYAKEVIEARNSDGSLKFRLSDASDYAGFYPNTIMQSEHLFGVINNSHQNIVQSLFKDANASLTQTQEKINIAYETGISPDDIRYKCWSLKEHDGTNTHHFQKYIGTDAIKPVNIVPLLRVSEMYLILMECLTPEAALEYFKVYRLARSLNSSLETVFTNDVRQRLESEYRKEFYGEGQMFFFYKRLHYTQFTWPQVIDVAPEVYALPIPKSQTAFE